MFGQKNPRNRHSSIYRFCLIAGERCENPFDQLWTSVRGAERLREENRITMKSFGECEKLFCDVVVFFLTLDLRTANKYLFCCPCEAGGPTDILMPILSQTLIIVPYYIMLVWERSEIGNSPTLFLWERHEYLDFLPLKIRSYGAICWGRGVVGTTRRRDSGLGCGLTIAFSVRKFSGGLRPFLFSCPACPKAAKLLDGRKFGKSIGVCERN